MALRMATTARRLSPWYSCPPNLRLRRVSCPLLPSRHFKVTTRLLVSLRWRRSLVNRTPLLFMATTHQRPLSSSSLLSRLAEARGSRSRPLLAPRPARARFRPLPSLHHTVHPPPPAPSRHRNEMDEAAPRGLKPRELALMTRRLFALDVVCLHLELLYHDAFPLPCFIDICRMI